MTGEVAGSKIAGACCRHRNQNSSATVSDNVTVVRNVSCPNQRQPGAALAPAGSLQAPVSLIAGAG